jgi:hypothetical protein
VTFTGPMKPTLILAAICAMTCLSATVTAQESRKVKLRTLCFEHVGDIRKVLLVGAQEKTVEVDLFTSGFSDEIEATVSGGELRFAIAEAGADGATTLKTVASGKAAAGTRQLAVFLPGSKDGTAYRLLVIDDSDEQFPLGTTLCFNFAPVPVRFAIGEHSEDLKPGGRALVPLARKVNDMNQCNVVISFADTTNKWVPVNNTRWLSLPQERALAISYIHPVSKQPSVNSYRETPPWKLPKL